MLISPTAEKGAVEELEFVGKIAGDGELETGDDTRDFASPLDLLLTSLQSLDAISFFEGACD